MLILKNNLLGVLMLGVCLIVIGCSEVVVNEPIAPEVSVPVEAALPANSLTWGPSYYADDLNIEAERNRDGLEFMKLIDQKALTGKVWGPSYAADETLVGPHPVPNVTSSVTWGPSYYAGDTNIEAERNRAELGFMKRIDLKSLRGLSEGPSYHQ